jgi:hypothetical protein
MVAKRVKKTQRRRNKKHQTRRGGFLGNFWKSSIPAPGLSQLYGYNLPSISDVTSGITNTVSNLGSSAYNLVSGLTNQNKLLLLGIVGAGTYQAAKTLYYNYLEKKRQEMITSYQSNPEIFLTKNSSTVIENIATIMTLTKSIDTEIIAFMNTGEDNFYANILD